MKLEYGLGVPLSALNIFGKLGRVGNAASYAAVAGPSLLRSAFGDTIYVSRWLRGGIALALRQYTRWLAKTWMSLKGIWDWADI
jgi:hypothetical protein